MGWANCIPLGGKQILSTLKVKGIEGREYEEKSNKRHLKFVYLKRDACKKLCYEI